jgi:chromosomal replication initiation ATPase DnaA
MTMTLAADERASYPRNIKARRAREFALRALDEQAAATLSHSFASDAERYAWVIEQTKQVFAGKPYLVALKKQRMYFALAATAFGLSIETLTNDARVRPVTEARQKIICFVFLMTETDWRTLGRMFNRDSSTIIHACRKYADEITPMLGAAVVRRVPKKTVR